MRKPRKYIFLLLCISLLFTGGCRQMLDAKAYTQAVLDVSYKNDAAAYIEMTGAPKEEAMKIFKGNLDATMEEFKAVRLSEELEENYRSLFEKIVACVSYSVGESTELKDENFSVEVTVEPVLLFDDTYEEFQAAAQEYAQQVTNSVINGGTLPADEEMKEKVYEIYYEILNNGLKKGVNYGPPEQVSVHVEKTEDNTYRIPEEDIKKLDEKLISQRKLTGEE